MNGILDRLLMGLSTTGVGMLVVFSGLVILIACISVMTRFTRRKKEAPAVKAAPAAEPLPVQAAQEAEEDDLSVIAAITAAIAVLWQDEGNESGFVVRRVRRAQSSTARARAARDEQIYSRL